MQRTKLCDRVLPAYTRGEEIFNMVSHIVGAVFGVVALILCVAVAAYNHNIWGIASGAVFGLAMVLLYTMSSIYHGLRSEPVKKVFQIIDHCSIFILIAGTYTPIALCNLRLENPVVGWSIFGFIWVIAIIGIVFNSIDLEKFKVFSMISYLGMGWCIIFTIRIVIRAIPLKGLVILLMGGISYTLGAVLYRLGKKIKYMHSVFHLFVVIGSILHFLVILIYVMPVK